MEDVRRDRSVKVAQSGIVAFDVKREPRMLAERRVGAAPVKQIKWSGAVGIEPGGDDGCPRGSHVVRRIVEQDAVSRLRKMQEEDEQGDKLSLIHI